MPVHKSIWNKLARGLKYAQVVTVGIHEKKGKITAHKWGPSGAKWLTKGLATLDKNRSIEVDNWNAFASKFDSLVSSRHLIFDTTSKQGNIDEADLLKAFVRSYFDFTDAGVVSFVKTKMGGGAQKASFKRIELLQPHTGEWHAIWENPAT